MIDKRFPNWDIDLEKGTVFNIILKRYVGSISKTNGYVYLGKGVLVHRLIWMVANGCDIPDGYDVHHIDGNKLNNSIYNLELIYHQKHVSQHSIGHKIDIKGEKNPFYGKHHNKEFIEKLSKKVAQYTLDGELVKIWNSFQEIGKNGFNYKNVNNVCKGKRKTCNGYIWKYINEK